jgi:N-acetylglucosamine-6-phosphate deacetylase
MEGSFSSGVAVIDLHTHGIGGLDTRVAEPPAMLKIASDQGRAGVSAILLSVYPGPMGAMRDQIAAVRQAMDRQGSSLEPASSGHQPGGPATILGVHLEGPFLNPARSGALDPSSFLEPREQTFRRLVEGFEQIIRTMTVAPELPGAERLIRLIANTGIAVNMGHSDARYAEAEAGFRAGARGITHLFNAMRPFHHREPGIAGFALINRDVYVEIIGDLRHLSIETVEIILRLKEPERVLLVSDSVRETGLPPPPEEGEAGGVLLGGSMTLPAVARGLIQRGLDGEIVMRAVTVNPLAYLGAAR